MKLSCLVLLFILGALRGTAQDTLRYDHSFKLPVKLNRPGYDTAVSQQPTEVHSFTLQVPDSSAVYIVVRSKSDSLKIIMDDGKAIRIKANDKDVYAYSITQEMAPGTRRFFIRTNAFCRYTVNVSGISLR